MKKIDYFIIFISIIIILIQLFLFKVALINLHDNYMILNVIIPLIVFGLLNLFLIISILFEYIFNKNYKNIFLITFSFFLYLLLLLIFIFVMI